MLALAPGIHREQARTRKSAPDFQERLARVVQHVSEFESAELTVHATAESGTATIHERPRSGMESALQAP